MSVTVCDNVERTRCSNSFTEVNSVSMDTKTTNTVGLVHTTEILHYLTHSTLTLGDGALPDDNSRVWSRLPESIWTVSSLTTFC